MSDEQLDRRAMIEAAMEAAEEGTLEAPEEKEIVEPEADPILEEVAAEKQVETEASADSNEETAESL